MNRNRFIDHSGRMTAQQRRNILAYIRRTFKGVYSVRIKWVRIHDIKSDGRVHDVPRHGWLCTATEMSRGKYSHALGVVHTILLTSEQVGK